MAVLRAAAQRNWASTDEISSDQALRNTAMEVQTPLYSRVEGDTVVDIYSRRIPLPQKKSYSIPVPDHSKKKKKILSCPVPEKTTPTPVLLLCRITPNLVPLPFWRSATL